MGGPMATWKLSFIFWWNLSHAWKQPRLEDFFNPNENKVGLGPNPDHETKQTKTKTWHVRNKNLTKFYCKKEIKT
jgi:hypothetical protein